MNAYYESGYLVNTELVKSEDETKSDSDLPDLTFSGYFMKPVHTFETVVISDIHLGSKVLRTEQLLDFLKHVHFKRLIINGDVFDSINMTRLDKQHWKVLSFLRKLTNSSKHIEVIWLRGNHDGFSDLLTQLLGIEVYFEYLLEWNDKKIMITHGDIYDKFITRYPLIADVADYFYRFIQKISPVKSKRLISAWIKRNSKTFIRNSERVRHGAIRDAQKIGADVAICGHTHLIDDTTEHGVRYLNPGSWTDAPAHFIGITDQQIEVVPFA
jgi:UDP-2,3-diacylglucosamine pyrophosphatase LpxH